MLFRNNYTPIGFKAPDAILALKDQIKTRLFKGLGLIQIVSV